MYILRSVLIFKCGRTNIYWRWSPFKIIHWTMDTRIQVL